MVNLLARETSKEVVLGLPKKRRLTSGRLLVGAAILLSAWSLRIAVVSLSPLAPTVTQELGLSRLFIGVFGMLPAVMFSVGALVTRQLTQRWGLERTVLIAMVATGFGLGARAFVSDGIAFMALSAVALGGIGTTNVLVPPLVKRYFSDKLALVSALYVTFLQLGTIVPAFVAVPLADAHGWRMSIGVWAIFGFIAALPWLGVVISRRGRDLEDGTADAPAERLAVPVWRTSLGWAMAALFGCTSGISYAMFAWIPSVLISAGASTIFAGSMVGALPIVGLLGSLVAPALVIRLRQPFILVAVCGFGYATGLLGLWAAPMAAPWLWVMLLGLGMCTFPIALVMINIRSRTPAGSQGLSSFTQGIGYIIGATGPLLFGVLHTKTGAWGAPFAFLGLLATAVIVGGWFVCRPRFIEDAR